jgi:hypothetical protein
MGRGRRLVLDPEVALSPTTPDLTLGVRLAGGVETEALQDRAGIVLAPAEFGHHPWRHTHPATHPLRSAQQVIQTFELEHRNG